MSMHIRCLQIFFTLSPTAVGAKFLTPAEQEYVHTHVKEHKVCGLLPSACEAH